MTTVNWRVFLRASRSTAAEKLLDRLFHSLQLDFEIIEIDMYWKDNALFTARGTCPFPVEEPRAAVFELLVRAGKVASHWTISTPTFFDGGTWRFSAGVTKAAGAHLSIPGVELLDLEICGVVSASP
jgi:hypothetical protein